MLEPPVSEVIILLIPPAIILPDPPSAAEKYIEFPHPPETVPYIDETKLP